MALETSPCSAELGYMTMHHAVHAAHAWLLTRTRPQLDQCKKTNPASRSVNRFQSNKDIAWG